MCDHVTLGPICAPKADERDDERIERRIKPNRSSPGPDHAGSACKSRPNTGRGFQLYPHPLENGFEGLSGLFFQRDSWRRGWAGFQSTKPPWRPDRSVKPPRIDAVGSVHCRSRSARLPPRSDASSQPVAPGGGVWDTEHHDGDGSQTDCNTGRFRTPFPFPFPLPTDRIVRRSLSFSPHFPGSDPRNSQ